jgi:hypothetical protein
MASSLLDFWTKILFPAAASGQVSAVIGNVVISLPSRSYSLRLWVTPLESVSATTINGDDGESVGDDRAEAEAVDEAEVEGAVEGPQATRINAATTHARDTIMERRPV